MCVDPLAYFPSLRHLPILETHQLLWPDESYCQDFARRLALALTVDGQLQSLHIELHGGLGAGKTTLVRHLLRALGVAGRVKSPTYAVVEPYELPALNIWHFDFYRFHDPSEWRDAGFRDIFAAAGLKLAEWPDKAAGFLPRADLVIALDVVDDTARRATISAHSATGHDLLRAADPAGDNP